MTGNKEIDSKLKKCSDKNKVSNFYLIEDDFKPEKAIEVKKKLDKAAVESAQSRAKYLDCVNSIMLSDEEEKMLELTLNSFYETFWEMVESYNRWMYSLDDKCTISPLEMQKISQFYSSKVKLYKLLEQRTREEFRRKKPKEVGYSPINELESIYKSLSRLQFEFYNSVNPELRKELLKGSLSQ